MITNLVVATITAYCACKVCCGPNAKGINAANKRPIPGVSIAASRNIPLGTTVYVMGRKYIVDDRLAKKYDSRFDIYFSSHQAAKQFGIKHKQQVQVILDR